MVGGNSPSNSHQVSISAPSQRLEAPGFGAIGLHADSAGSLEDGFYVNMVASAREEGHYTGNMAFFSDRFNLIGLTGSTPVEYQSAAAALESTDGPKTFNNLTAVGGPTTNAPASTASPSPAMLSTTMVPSPSTSSTTNQNAPTHRKVDMGSRARIGIAVGTMFGAILVTLVLFLMYLLQRKRISNTNLDPGTIPTTTEKAELPGGGKIRSELEHVEGLNVADKVGKLDRPQGENILAELPTGWTGWEAPALLEMELSRPRTLCVSPISNKLEMAISPC